MWILTKKKAPRYSRKEGIHSYLLASPRTCNARQLTATLVEIDPEGFQRLHRHQPEQLYFILQGTGQMTVGDETREVHSGDCIFIPANAEHGLKNTGAKTLIYFSAASPSFTLQELKDFWPIDSPR